MKNFFNVETLNITEAFETLTSDKFPMKDSICTPNVFIETIQNEDDYYNSESFKSIYKPYAPSEAKRSETIGRKFKFVKGYVTKENPDTNYGQSTNLWKLYEVNSKEGKRLMLKQESAHSMLSSNTPNIAIPVSDGFILTNLKHDNPTFIVENEICSWK